MHSRTDVRFTYEDYLSVPEGSSERFEIIDGELFVTPTPRFRHQQVVMNVSRILSTLVLEHGLGEVVASPITVRLADDSVTEPDVVFLGLDRLGIIEGGRIHGAPDLVVEVLSASNSGYDRGLKRRKYMSSGVPELWILDADEDTVEVWRPGMRTAEPAHVVVLWRVAEQSFEISLADVFRRS